MSYLQHFQAQETPGYGGSGPSIWGCGLPPAPSAVLSTAGQQIQPDTVSPHVSSQFIELLKGYRSSGGLLRAQMVAARCNPRSGTDVHTLAGWIVGRKVVSFEWLSSIWLPVFQFNPSDMSRLSGLDEVLSELVSVCDRWEVASWFAQPNPWLGDALPADQMATTAPEVLVAARAERFVIAG